MFLGRSRQVKLYDKNSGEIPAEYTTSILRWDLTRVFVIEFNLPEPPQEHSVNIVFSLM
jgi:hypothetical protein